jgi:hypothetical protein
MNAGVDEATYDNQLMFEGLIWSKTENILRRMNVKERLRIVVARRNEMFNVPFIVLISWSHLMTVQTRRRSFFAYIM